MSSVARRRSGTYSTQRKPSGASNRSAATRSASWAETTNPPSRTAAALSGCDSIVDAIWSSASSSGRLAPASSASAAPATTPPTVAAADDPRPRDSGIALCIAIRQPSVAGRGPSAVSSAASTPATNRFDRVAGSSNAPSPSTSSSIGPSFWVASATSNASTATRFTRSSASPRQS